MLRRGVSPAAQEVQVPALNDLAGWKASDRRVACRSAEYLDCDDRLQSSRAVKRYFGDDDLKYLLEEHRERAVAMAYSAWGILDYRPTKTSKTHAEKMRAEGLSEPEGMLLGARMEACPTLYRVAGHDPKAGTVDLDDVLLGGTVTMYDQLMSESIENGLFIAGRAFPAGRFHFLELAGPPLGAGMGMAAEPLAAPLLAPPREPHSELFEATASRRKVGRNEPCPCGSGQKYKKCCGR